MLLLSSAWKRPCCVSDLGVGSGWPVPYVPPLRPLLNLAAVQYSFP